MTHPQSRTSHRATQSGNALFLILIACALFAFLSYVVASSTRSNDGGGREDNTKLRASQVIQYATYMEQAILRMRFREIPAENLCFDADGWGHNDYYFSACDDTKNQVFYTGEGGGGVIWTKPPEGANDGSPWYIPANVCVAGIGFYVEDDCNADSSGDSENLVLALPGISKVVCIEINNSLGIANPNGEPPKAGGDLFDSGNPYYTGTFNDGAAINSAGSDPAILRNQQFGCVEGNGNPPAGTYVYYHVLLPR